MAGWLGTNLTSQLDSLRNVLGSSETTVNHYRYNFFLGGEGLVEQYFKETPHCLFSKISAKSGFKL
jgi:hypothetical protein